MLHLRMKSTARTEYQQTSHCQRHSTDEEEPDQGWIGFLAHNEGPEDSPRVRKAFSLASVECFNKSFGFPCTRMVFVSASRNMESSAIMKMLANSCVTT